MPDWAAKRAALKLSAKRRREARIRREMRAAAASVHPDPGALDKIRKRTRGN